MKKISLLIISLLIALPTLSKTVEEVVFPESIEMNKEKLVLNGVGIRTATIFSVKVYVGGLYLKKKMTKGEVILKDEGNKYIRMHFVRDVDADKLQDGWKSAFEDSKVDQTKFKAEIAKFLSYITNMKEKKEMTLTFSKTGLDLNVDGVKNSIPNKEFATAVLSVWFVNPGDKDLRDGLLGKNS